METFTDNKQKVIALGLAVTNWKFTKNDIDRIKNLQAVCVPTTSFSWLDGRYLKSRVLCSRMYQNTLQNLSLNMRFL